MFLHNRRARINSSRVYSASGRLVLIQQRMLRPQFLTIQNAVDTFLGPAPEPLPRLDQSRTEEILTVSHEDRCIMTQAFAEHPPAAVGDPMSFEDVVRLSDQADVRVRRQQIGQDRRATSGEPVDEDSLLVQHAAPPKPSTQLR